MFYQSSGRGWWVSALNSGVNLELEQAAVSTVKLKHKIVSSLKEGKDKLEGTRTEGKSSVHLTSS
jgi:hypothetical protein